MKKVQLLYNPMSGDKSFRYYLDNFIAKFQTAGYEARIFRSSKKGDMGQFFREFDQTDFEGIFVSGGDGSVNEVVNGMMNHDIHVPLGIIPSGTANDFANFLNMPSELDACFDTFLRRNIKAIDLGKANDNYFINVCSGGLFTNVSQNIDIHFKNTLGKLAYYLKGVEQLPNFQPIPLRITTSSKVIEENFCLFLILNGTGAGGFNNLAKNSSIDDGLVDIVAVRARPLHELAVLFIKILKGEHLNDRSVLYFKEQYVKIECMSDKAIFYESDIDGEQGPNLPLEVSVVPKAILVYSNI